MMIGTHHLHCCVVAIDVLVDVKSATIPQHLDESLLGLERDESIEKSVVVVLARHMVVRFLTQRRRNVHSTYGTCSSLS